MVSVTSASCYIMSASHYYPHFQYRSSMYIRGLIPRNLAELAEAVLIATHVDMRMIQQNREKRSTHKRKNTFKAWSSSNLFDSIMIFLKVVWKM